MKPPKKAVAISYQEKTDLAPRVVAKGKGKVAETIIQLAKANNVPLYEDPNLSYALETLELNAHIPPELFHALAEVLAFVYRLDRELA